MISYLLIIDRKKLLAIISVKNEKNLQEIGQG